MANEIYILKRGESAWACSTVDELWGLRAIQKRLHSFMSDVSTFEEFQRRLNTGERLHIGVIEVWKCQHCKPYEECEWQRLIKETDTRNAEFERIVQTMGAHIIDDSGTIISPLIKQNKEDTAMKPLSKEILENLREQYPQGTRVELVSMNDTYTQIPVGTCGTVGVVDDIGTIHVRWDNGSGLGVVYGEDSVRIVSDSETELKSDGDND